MEKVPLCPKCGFSKELHEPLWGCDSVRKPNEEFTSTFHVRIKTGMTFDNIVGNRLTDRAIKKYENSGYYHAEKRKARKERAEKRAEKSNFRKDPDGRLIYRPW